MYDNKSLGCTISGGTFTSKPLFCYLHPVFNHPTTLATTILQHAMHLHPVVPFNPGHNELCRMDFTAANKDINPDLLLNTAGFSEYINVTLQQHLCTYGIGGYNEHRTIYSRSNVFDAGSSGEEPRRLHLGIDIWGQAGTPVFAPLGGTVHSFAFNDQFGDYGATIILLHQLEGEVFHTLYGHLSIADLAHIQQGKYIGPGERVGHFGSPAENGGWPPHLHIQVINDMHNHWGDYPGVCRYSEREYYLHNCPDPDFILQMMRYAK